MGKHLPSSKTIRTCKLNGRVLLYSTCSYLAYYINEKYYDHIHFVWCTDAFHSMGQPGTSNPKNLCRRFLEAIIKNDDHDEIIKNNKKGIYKGIKQKLKDGVITSNQAKEIRQRVKLADFAEFYPVVYLIDKKAVERRKGKKIESVSVDKRANEQSVEYCIEDLAREEFEAISFDDILRIVYDDLE